jgi:2-oxoglutarate dehydrogenase E2 component (dihydrolipoamide succinyltransferase)
MDSNMLMVQLPAPGESVKEVTVSRFLVQNNQVVAKDTILCEIESDKATMEVVAPASGKVQLLIEANKTYPVGTNVVQIDTSVPFEQKKVEESPVVAQAKPVPVKTSKEGIRKGMTEFLSAEKTESKPVEQEPVLQSAAGAVKREPMSLIRKTIAKRLVDVKNQTAMLTTFNEVDMSHLMALRKQHQEAFGKKYGIKLGFMAFFTKAVERALQIYPRVNARIDGDDIVYPDGIHIGIAVSTDRGLVVPVVRHVEKLTLAQVEQEIARLANLGREGKLSIKDFEGGTFTITNGGVFGSMLSTPIINPPQSGILGMHATTDRCVAIQGKVEIRPMMYIALSYDHRIIDGKEAVGFLVEVKRWIENPEIGVLNL